MTHDETDALYIALLRLSREADWVKHDTPTPPVELNVGELIALDDLIAGFRRHRRNITARKRRAAKVAK